MLKKSNMSKLLNSWLTNNQPSAPAKLSVISGVSFATIQALRDMKYRSNLRTSTLIKIAESIGVTPSEFIADLIECEKEKKTRAQSK